MDSADQHPHDHDHLDGNALAGALEQFMVDLTSARCTCAHCGSSSALGAALLYTHAPGMVLRCPTCTSVLLCLSDQEGRQVLTVDGIRQFAVTSR
ncbi:MAG: hypothetical protein AVDCRST_MAG83-2119 [uncultured Arthrobacter sp.]|uniref:Uncharacterized protein n=1 Tax=uncultured Arthrobacter sp. TaxID=114050 RepID=A0A6J4I7W9_9MICC|nr:DUF6510 family protein [uncultured Arthrobacter sp.]CAA9243855.1 MAG: hypothetical protein AVDCRST_MAG83-2119 [uncultured Arthrobacter sp.]